MPLILFVVNAHEFTASHRMPIIKGAIDSGYIVKAVAPKKSPAIDRLNAEGIETYEINLSRRKLNILDEIISIYELSKLYAKVNPDIVHHATIKPVIYGTVAAYFSKIGGIVNAITGLGYIYTGNDLRTKVLRFIVNILYKIIFKIKNQKIIFQNNDDKNMFIYLNLLEKSNSLLIPSSGVDLLYYKYYPEKEGPLKVALPARMIWDKGIAEFIEAAEFINNKDIHFILVGGLDEGNPNSISQDEFVKIENDGVVEWIGHVHDMREIYSTVHIVVLPSYYREGLPKVLLEAAASGRPVITTDAPGCRDALINGKTGYLIPTKDSMALAEKIIALINDPIKRIKMGKAGRQFVESRFSAQKVVQDTLKVYEDLIASKT